MAQQGSNKPSHIVSKKAGGVISAYRILTFGDDDQTVVQASAATDAFLGVAIPGSGSDPSGMAEEGDIVDFATEGMPAVEYGGVVERGDPLTSDGDGRAVKASGGNSIIGIAMNDGVTGDIGSVKIDRSTA